MKPYYEKNGIVIHHGDCREVLPTLEAVEHVITDPPYGVDIYQRMRSPVSDGGNRGYKIKGGDSISAMRAGAIGSVDELLEPVACHIGRLTQRWAVVFSDAESNHLWRVSLTAAGLRHMRVGIWVKPDAMPQMTGDRPGVGFEPCEISHGQGRPRWNGGGYPAVWYHHTAKGDARPYHPCPKPLPLMAELVSLFTDPGETILDPFMGPGTTLVAAYQLGRKAIGIELEEKWCEVAAKRLDAMELPMFPDMKPSQKVLI